MSETSVNLQVYESAVKGQQSFRAAFRRERDDNRRLREALIEVRSGICAGAAFVRRNEDGADRCLEVLKIIDDALATLTASVRSDES